MEDQDEDSRGNRDTNQGGRGATMSRWEIQHGRIERTTHASLDELSFVSKVEKRALHAHSFTINLMTKKVSVSRFKNPGIR